MKFEDDWSGSRVVNEEIVTAAMIHPNQFQMVQGIVLRGRPHRD
jgi:hypothetical protein